MVVCVWIGWGCHRKPTKVRDLIPSTGRWKPIPRDLTTTEMFLRDFLREKEDDEDHEPQTSNPRCSPPLLGCVLGCSGKDASEMFRSCKTINELTAVCTCPAPPGLFSGVWSSATELRPPPEPSGWSSAEVQTFKETWIPVCFLCESFL